MTSWTFIFNVYCEAFQTWISEENHVWFGLLTKNLLTERASDFKSGTIRVSRSFYDMQVIRMGRILGSWAKCEYLIGQI